MRFIIKRNTHENQRIGVLSEFSKLPSLAIETPTTALFTKGGSVQHLTTEVLDRVFTESKLLWVPLSNSLQLEKGLKLQNEGIAKFSGLPRHAICMSINDVIEVNPSGHFENDMVPLWTKNGKKMITAARYMELMDVFKPDMILAIADNNTSLNEKQKRIAKSVERTCSMLEVCVKKYAMSEQMQSSALIGVLVGVTRPKECEDCLKKLLAHEESLFGVALSGIAGSTEESLQVTVDQLEPIFKKLNDMLPKRLLRILEGCWSPVIVLSAIQYGWDIFDGSYPAKLSNTGSALKLNLYGQEDDELCILDLKNKQYAEDFKPILIGCECLACKKHTRAYIHHLLNTREMLSTVLLSIHNLHHFDQMFVVARQHINSNTFHEYKEAVSKQYNLFESHRKTEVPETNKTEERPEIRAIKKKRLTNENGYKGYKGNINT